MAFYSTTLLNYFICFIFIGWSRHRVEICPQQIVHGLHQRWIHTAYPLQHYTVPQNNLLYSPVLFPALLWWRWWWRHNTASRPSCWPWDVSKYTVQWERSRETKSEIKILFVCVKAMDIQYRDTYFVLQYCVYLQQHWSSSASVCNCYALWNQLVHHYTWNGHVPLGFAY